MPFSPAAATRADTVRPWVVRSVWVLQVLSFGMAFGDALRGHSRAVQLVAVCAAWMVWTVVLLAVSLAHPAGLTAIRVGLTTLTGASLWTLVANGPAAWQRGLLAIGTVAALASLGSAETTTWCIDGPAYPNESRHALKIPIGFLPITLITCALTVGSAVAVLLLFACRQWPAGVVMALVAGGIGWVGVRSLHQLSRRFVVFVPAGFVVHDAFTLFDPVLFRRNVVERIALAEVDTDSLDLTLGATGTPIDVRLTEKVEVTKLSPDRKTGEAGRTARFLVSPARPGAVLREATARGYTTA